MASQQLMQFLQSHENHRFNEMKLIEQEQYYINLLKEQREKMELLKNEFLKKDQVIVDLQCQVNELWEENERLKEVHQSSIKKKEQDFYRMNKLQLEKDSLIKDMIELKDMIDHLRQENDTLNTFYLKNEDQQRQLQEQLILLGEENSRLKTEILKLDEILFSCEPMRVENEKLQEKLKYYKLEKRKLHQDMKQSKQEINKQIEEFKQVVTKDFKNEMERLQEYKECYQQLNQKVQDLEERCRSLTDENDQLKQEIQSLYQKEESDIKIKSEIDRVRQDLMSVRQQETQKLQELFNGMISLSSLANSREQFY
ncbi:unnamed protein product (macronuclear) [Paramecium tetraurelia]|uniref:Uncharacterized protein n=1 Tax=Paramecium tetraurelia TaxID=5888 RepID=A0DBJ5_PARTE|nr:uncharacterized protein GSPATT00015308001 [Paramecium tetraurelia]CAK80412.1 unnamed protein product [Paramecium tetraurelia]|eukprot:XP_001447809.1 hypothetical protein (macronuclear) [Paramecium tetraurelia strain d4-2]